MSRRAPFLQREMISLCGKAMHGWAMLEENDQVAVALSGGKDSLALLWLLAERRRRIPIDFGIKAIHIEMGFGTVDVPALREFCQGLGVEFHLIETDYGPRAHTPENREKSPCFFCAMHRRRELFQKASQLGCRKLALAHHQDDIHETFLMNLLYSGNLSTMLPVQPFFGGELVVIRPLSLVSADHTRRFSKLMNFPVQPPCCPSASEGKRARVRELLNSLYRENKKVRPSIWGALTNSGLKMLPSAPSTQPLRKSKKDKEN
ncbi:tRNA lysidine(34) synthetase [Dethiosulfatarculus sandiegensis]|uniref:Potassium-transporting ATPase subunit A n=1 Tax=Dethiosulfatarculus sandiegensis TaxID=1429043 RepID=A0A0D2JQW1_9BACT|nr:tRNA 2-thiocytidine biosynthesis TtcA family protein [Dethiosulfatarculus sandiegensis]KIX11885.1 potassium-transporting ATPase subunit A [Dethiosulfatarculus sandiegensis]